MRIRNITTAVIESNFDWAIVKVETDAGITGYGELFPGPGTTAVVREFFSILEGEDCTHIDRLHRRMKAACVHASPGVAWNEVSADARWCRCSVHGGHDDPHQPAGPTAASSTGRVLKSFAGLTATVRFEEDGLRVVVTVDRKE